MAACVIFVLAVLFKELLMLVVLFLAQIPLVILGDGLFLTLLILSTNLVVNYVSSSFQPTSDTLTHSTAMVPSFITVLEAVKEGKCVYLAGVSRCAAYYTQGVEGIKSVYFEEWGSDRVVIYELVNLDPLLVTVDTH